MGAETGYSNMPSPVAPRERSHLEVLNDRFISDNDELTALVEQVIGMGHKMNNTNVPQETEHNKKEQQFSEGHLLYYQSQLERMELTIYHFRAAVQKLQSII